MTSICASDKRGDPLGPPASRWNARVRLALTPAALAALLSASLCHNLCLPLGHDQGLYQYIAERVIVGDRMYVDVWDQNAPGIVGIHWLATHLCGRTSLAFRLFDAGWQAATLAVIVLLGGCDGRRWNVGWLAAILYTLAYYGMGYVHTGQREGFAVLPMLLAVLAVTSDTPGTAGLTAAARHAFAGLMFSIVFAIKPPLGLTFGALWLLALVELWRPVSRQRLSPAAIAGLTLGFCMGVGIAVALLVHSGCWSAFWPTFTRSRVPGYILGPSLIREIALPTAAAGLLIGAIVLAWDGGDSSRRGRATDLKARFARRWPAIVAAIALVGLMLSILRWPAWQSTFLRIGFLLIPALGAVMIRPWSERSRIWRLHCLLAGASMAAIFLQGQFYLYQFPPLLACAAYMAAAELVDVVQRAGQERPSALWGHMAWPSICLACVTCLGFAHWGDAMTFPSVRPYFLSSRTLMQHYGDITKHKPTFPRFDTSAAVAARVQALTTDSERIACLVDEPRLYWLCRRPAACPLLRPCEVHRNLFTEFLQGIQAARPAVLLVRIPPFARNASDREQIESSIVGWAVSFYGPLAGRVCGDYYLAEVIGDVGILRPWAGRD